ncbi:MltF family protein [Falsiroseomonas oryzae]|uniref:transglycosylase SLT domain-containing protein n=1 Tax=Falsiroseomonas oryzae TaxID=2766473 RepID=UPI0022EB86A5|nr:transporter substrate-binding domain-containing protein [Roseomonas sp. MO-31]
MAPFAGARRLLVRLFLGLLLALPALGPARAQGADADDEGTTVGDSLLLILNEPFRGDWPQIRERRLLRVLTTYNRTNFLIEHGEGRGLEYEAMRWLEQFVNDRNAPGGPAGLRVVFVPVARNDLIPALLDGRGDVIAAGMTATEERAGRVAFSTPYMRGVAEVVVRHKDAPPVATPEDLSGRALLLTRGTSYVANARALDERLRAAGRPGIRIVEAPDHLETEDVLEMVNAGIVPYTIADSHLAEVWDRLLANIVVQDGVALARDQTIAWAVRPDAPELKALLDRFVTERVARDRATAMTIFRRYFESTRFLDNPLNLDVRDRIRQYSRHFRAESDRVGFNWLMMLAQSFQESRLDPAARSHVGAVGMMQLMPATGREVGVRNLADAEQNIRGGIIYMDQLRDRYFNDPAIDEANRIYFALAAYNAGPNRINRLRQEAAREGLDPNRWFGQVERVVQRRVGSEPVRYVGNIVTYFLTYAGIAEQMGERDEDRAELRRILAGE